MKKKDHSTRRICYSQIILISLFFIALWLPQFESIFHLEPQKGLSEKRSYSKRPEFTMKYLYKFSRRYEKYFNDSFGFRNTLIGIHNYVKFFWLKVSPTQKVIIGKQGWLFYNSIDDNSKIVTDIIRDFHGCAQFSTAELKRIKWNLESRQDDLTRNGIIYLVVIIPVKHKIYPEFLPESISHIRGMTRLDQLKEYLYLNSKIRIIDLTAPLIKAKQNYLTYYLTDSHWNDYGAFVGYREIVKHLKKYYTDLNIFTLNDFIINKRYGPGRNLIALLSITGDFREEIYELIPQNPYVSVEKGVRDPYSLRVLKEIENSNLPRAVMFRDSYTDAMMPFLSENFSRILYIWSHKWDAGLIEKEKPDIVIHEIAESSLRVLLGE